MSPWRRPAISALVVTAPSGVVLPSGDHVYDVPVAVVLDRQRLGRSGAGFDDPAGCQIDATVGAAESRAGWRIIERGTPPVRGVALRVGHVDEGDGVADEMRKLLDYIVDHYVVRDELKSIDLDASPREPGDVIEADKEQAVRREADRADELGKAFARGLALAYQRHAMGGLELPLDDRKPEEDRIADALIRFLVSHDLASSRTQETTPLHYTYHVAVDWDRLGKVASAAGIDLDHALQQYAT